jgi:LmbE family N-acetylglucosaminyl deacetylase
MEMSTNDQIIWHFSKVAILVAHPDDETLWAGGLILNHKQTEWTILSLCRKNDIDRSAKFEKVTRRLGAVAYMADVDDEPEQKPLCSGELKNAILGLLPETQFDLVITHSFVGEYTRHRRHEETARAVYGLWLTEQLKTAELWMFAYEDGQKSYYPKGIRNADIFIELPEDIWKTKYEIITQIYGFSENSWEALTTPRNEAFWCLRKDQN